MNGFRWLCVFGLVFSAGLSPGFAAQPDEELFLNQPGYVDEVFTDMAEAPSPPPVDRAPAPPPAATVYPETPSFPAAAAIACPEPCGCGSCACRACGCRACRCNLGEPWKLPQPCFLQQHNILLGGWIQQGITGNPQNPVDGFNGPVATNDLANQYQMNQLWLFLYKPVKTDGCGWDIGGRADVVYGTDWRFGDCYGLESRFDSNQSYYGLILPQFYGEIGYNDLSVRFGHYAAAFSYEQIPAPANFFYSHCYAMNGFSEPLLVTGVEASWQATDQLKITGGVNRGWMMFEDNNHHYDFLGGIKWSSQNKKTDVSFMVTTGPQDPAGEQNVFVYALVLQRKLSERLTYVIQNDVGFQDDGDPRNGNDAEWYDICQWLIYKINPCWSAGLRVEWFRDDDGARVAGVGNVIQSAKGWLGAPGFAGNFYEVTAGLNWRPHANFVFRPEIRYDWYQGTQNLAGDYPFDGGTKKDQLLLAVDMIFTY